MIGTKFFIVETLHKHLRRRMFIVKTKVKEKIKLIKVPQPALTEVHSTFRFNMKLPEKCV